MITSLKDPDPFYPCMCVHGYESHNIFKDQYLDFACSVCGCPTYRPIHVDMHYMPEGP